MDGPSYFLEIKSSSSKGWTGARTSKCKRRYYWTRRNTSGLRPLRCICSGVHSPCWNCHENPVQVLRNPEGFHIVGLSGNRSLTLFQLNKIEKQQGNMLIVPSLIQDRLTSSLSNRKGTTVRCASNTGLWRKDDCPFGAGLYLGGAMLQRGMKAHLYLWQARRRRLRSKRDCKQAKEKESNHGWMKVKGEQKGEQRVGGVMKKGPRR